MKNYNFIFKINIFLTLVLLGLFGFRLYLSDMSATAGKDLSSIQNEIRLLEKENEYLKNQYLSYTSLGNLKLLALENGYVESSVEYIIPAKLASR